MRKFKTGLFLFLLLFGLMSHTVSAMESDRILTEEEMERMIPIEENAYYDKDKGRFLYTVGGMEIGMSVPDGMITNKAVAITVPAGIEPSIYRDGKLLSKPELSSIADPGAYVVYFGDNVGGIEFTIVSEQNSYLMQYTMPTSFSVDSVIYNDQPIAASKTYVDFSNEGDYRISYHSDLVGLSYELSLRIDHTTPTLEFTNLTNGYAAGPVEILGVSENETVTVMRDGVEVAYQQVLTVPGKYTVTVSDQAGNSNTYHFTISVYVNLNGWMILAAVLVLIVLIGLYMWISRKRLKIR